MNKIVLSIFALTLITSAVAQTLPGNITTYQATDLYGNTNGIVSPVPGVYIRPPQWTRDLATIANNSAANAANSAATANAAAVAAAATTTAAKDKPTETPNQIMNNVLPNTTANVTNTPEVIKQKRVGQVAIQNQNTSTKDISGLNTTSIQEFEASGKTNLEASYSNFLMKR